MLNYLFPKERKFEAAPPSPPPRVLSGNQINEQAQSLFLTKLPAEIRNKIYRSLFSSTTGLYDSKLLPTLSAGSQRLFVEMNGPRLSRNKKHGGNQESEIQRPPHPLSLLLTCRKINQEATVLAFHHYTFTASCCSSIFTTFYNLRLRTSHLSMQQMNAISCLSLDVGYDAWAYIGRVGNFMANSILLFPNIESLEIRIKRGRMSRNLVHSDPMTSPTTAMLGGDNDEGMEGWKRDGIKRYVPYWWNQAVTSGFNGRAFAWQKGQKWSVEYPQFESSSFLLTQEFDSQTGWTLRGQMDTESIGQVEGVDFCACGCGEPSWLFAMLVQETGRRVQVKLVYYGSSEIERQRERLGLNVYLRPGAEHLPVQAVGENRGFMWNVGDEYWLDIKARRGDWGALWVKFWKERERNVEDETASGVTKAILSWWRPAKNKVRNDEEGRGGAENDSEAMTPTDWNRGSIREKIEGLPGAPNNE